MRLPGLFYSFRLAVLWPLLVAVVVAGLVLWNRLPRVLEESAAHNLDSVLTVLAPMVGDRASESPETLQQWVRRTANETDLALVKHAVRLHGGNVEVESQLGVGSTFRVDLPIGGD